MFSLSRGGQTGLAGLLLSASPPNMEHVSVAVCNSDNHCKNLLKLRYLTYFKRSAPKCYIYQSGRQKNQF